MNVSCSTNPCPTILNSTCVFYEGGNLVYTGILTNDNLQIALEKIDQKFQDAGLGYVFDNGLVQTTPGAPVILGGPLLQNTTITSSGFDLAITGNLIAGAHITAGGTSTDFVKGDGSLDNTSYQPAGNYITALTGDGTASGPGSAIFTLSNTSVIPNTYGSGNDIPIITVDSKGRITNATSSPIAFPSQSIILAGDAYGAGFTGSSVNVTLTTVNSNIYAVNTPLKFSVNDKGLVTGASALTNLDLDAIYGYTPVPNTRTITINGVTQDLSVNRTWTISAGTGTVTSVGVTSGTGISASVSNPTTTPNITITNTAPDQTVVLTPGTGIGITGTYPNFTIATTGTGSVPTLQQVVNVGNGISNFGGVGNASIQSTNFTNGRTLYLNDNSFPTIRLVDNANASNNLQIDIDTLSIDGVSYNWSSIVNPTIPTLQQVTDQGSTTTNSITLDDTVNQIVLDNTGIYSPSPNIHIFDNVAGASASLQSNVLTLQDTGNPTLLANYYTNQINVINSFGNFVLLYPSQSGTFALSVNGQTADGTGAITIPVGTSILVALPFTTDHTTANGNPYLIGDVVYYLGNVYRCIAGNDSILPTNASYWTSLGAGYPLIQQPADWNSTSGNNQILNKPTIPAAQIQSDWTQSNNVALDFIKNKPTIPAAQVNSDWNATSGLAEILNKPTIPTVGTWGALNYPTWASGTPFVKMTAVGTFALDTNTYLTSAVISVGATSPITSSGGTAPVISTSMATNKLIGRSSAGVGVMEEITVGTGLSLSGGTLNATAQSVGFEQNFLLMGA